MPEGGRSVNGKARDRRQTFGIGSEKKAAKAPVQGVTTILSRTAGLERQRKKLNT
jgi:hypothetical protein